MLKYFLSRVETIYLEKYNCEKAKHELEKNEISVCKQ